MTIPFELEGFTEIQESSLDAFDSQFSFHDSYIEAMSMISHQTREATNNILRVMFRHMLCSPTSHLGWTKDCDIEFVLFGMEYIHIGDFGPFGGGTLDYEYLEIHAEEYYSDEEPKTRKYFVLVDGHVVIACRKLYYRVL